MLVFLEWQVGQGTVYVGLKHYSSLFADPEFLGSFLASLHWVFGHLLLIWILALFWAILLNEKILARGVYQALLFPPCILGDVTTAVVWKLIYYPRYGLFAGIFSLFGPNRLASLKWLTTPNLAMQPMLRRLQTRQKSLFELRIKNY